MTGDELARLIAAPPAPSLPLIDGFLYPRTVTMLTGEAGAGKTVLGAQLALSLSSATPLFGQLTIATPARVYFLQAEGSWEGQLRRLHLMSHVVPVDTRYLYWDAQHRSRVFALSLRTVDAKLKEMEAAFAPYVPEVFVLDPIYKVAGGDLAKAEPALALVEFSDRLLHTFGATVLLLHHPHRERVSVYGKPIEEDDAFYGHSFLRNHVEFAYRFKQLTPDGLTSELTATKRREEDVRQTIRLCYHPETYTCSMLPELPVERKGEAIRAYLQQLAQTHQTTSFKEVQARLGVGSSYLRELQARLLQDGLLVCWTEPGKPTVWVPKLLKPTEISGVRS